MAAVREFDATLDHADGDQAFVGFQRLAALVGDGHTRVSFPHDWPGEITLPLTIKHFGNEYRVITAAPGLEKAVGARVVKIEDTPIAESVQKLASLAPQDELPGLTALFVDNMLVSPRTLHGAGILPSHEAARYTLVDDTGREFIVEAHAVPAKGLDKTRWVSACGSPMLADRKPEETFYFVYLPDSRAVYCNVRLMRNLSRPGKALIAWLKEHRGEIDKLVIDLRQNGGGDYFIGLRHLVHPIRDLPFINRKGHLFVIIGTRTFSAALANATHFRTQTEAILVGESIGEKPNSYSEKREMTLPNSRLVASYSVRFYEFMKGGENIVRPDHEVQASWADYKTGVDPALQWALNYRAGN